MDIKDLFKMARRRWKMIAAFFLAGVLGAAFFSLTAKPTYHSTARVFIAVNAGTGDTAQAYGGIFASQRVKSYADLAQSRELVQRVIRRLDLNLTPDQLASKITATAIQDTTIITIEVRDSNPQVAQKLAQVESEEFTDYLAELETTSGGSDSLVQASVTDPANFDGTPIAPRTGLNIVVAAVIGLLIGFSAALLRDMLDNTVSSAQDVEKTVDVPVLASIGFDNDFPKHPLLSEINSHAPISEAYRLLRTNLQFLALDTRPKSIVITSAVPGEGKTSTATNLAIALAQTGLRVLLVDADLRRPRAAKVLGLERSVGVTTVLVGRTKLQESIQRHSGSGIYVLASGPIPPNPTEVLQSRTAQALFQELGEHFDMVIIDAPPLLPVADAAVTARDVDGAILVVKHGSTSKEQLRQAAQRLRAVDANILGVAVNMTPRRSADDYGYAYGYGYEPLGADS